MDVFDFALNMEKDGKAYYEKLANQALLPGLKTIFMGLAEDEQKHYEIFQSLKMKRSALPMHATTIIAETKNIFEELLKEKKTLKGVDESLAAYQHAMKIEADSFRLYEKAAIEEKDPATKSLLMKVAEEEHKHFNILENIYNFVNAPNQYLAWGEFSNLDEIRQFGRDIDN